jgi:hypothetical protein
VAERGIPVRELGGIGRSFNGGVLADAVEPGDADGFVLTRNLAEGAGTTTCWR